MWFCVCWIFGNASLPPRVRGWWLSLDHQFCVDTWYFTTRGTCLVHSCHISVTRLPNSHFIVGSTLVYFAKNGEIEFLSHKSCLNKTKNIKTHTERPQESERVVTRFATFNMQQQPKSRTRDLVSQIFGNRYDAMNRQPALHDSLQDYQSET